MSDKKPKLLVIAGPNGSGKTSVTTQKSANDDTAPVLRVYQLVQ